MALHNEHRIMIVGNKSGKEGNTEWECLDYPGHNSKWWMWL